jgi:hypothetical protein
MNRTSIYIHKDDIAALKAAAWTGSVNIVSIEEKLDDHNVRVTIDYAWDFNLFFLGTYFGIEKSYSKKNETHPH